MPDPFPHLNETTPALERTLDLAASDERSKDLRAAERVIVALLAEVHQTARPVDVQVRRSAYAWLFEQASREADDARRNS